MESPFSNTQKIRRAADWWQVMEIIYGSETEADEERPPEEAQEEDPAPVDNPRP